MAPAFWNCVRSLTLPRAGLSDAGNVSPGGLMPHALYERAQSRVAVAKSIRTTLPCNPVRVNLGLLPAYTRSPATPDGDVCPEYGKYEVTGILLDAPDAELTLIAERLASQRGSV